MDNIKSNTNLIAILLGISIFTTGGAGLTVQYLIATSTSFILGSSIVVFSIVIGVMLGAMGVAGWVQERIGDNNLIEKFFIIESLLFVLGSFTPFILFWAYGNAFEYFNFVLISLTTAIGLLIGLEIPLVVRILDKMGIGLSKNLKLVFGLDYIGAMVFMLVWVFYLLPHIPIYRIGFVVSGVNYTVAIVTVSFIILTSVGRIKPMLKLGVVALPLLGLYSYGITNASKWETLLEYKLYDDTVVHTETTKYAHIVITENKKSQCGTDVRLYLNGNTQFSSCDEHIYHDNLIVPVMNAVDYVSSVLIVGGGDGLALRDVLKYNPSVVDIVDIDGRLLDISKTNTHLSALNEGSFDNAIVRKLDSGIEQTNLFLPVVIDGVEVAQVGRYHLDASVFIRSADKRYDVIIVDLPDPSSVELAKLYTRGFYRALATKLNDGGYFVVQSTSPIHAPEVFLEIGRTLESGGISVLPYHDNVPSFGEWGYWIGCVSSGCIDSLLGTMNDTTELKVPTSYLTKKRFIANTNFGKRNGIAFLDSANGDEINTIITPTIFIRYEKAWTNY